MTEKTWTIGQLARRFDLARGTLLYYDRIGLLSPRARTSGNYRVYGEGDVERLEKIRRYRAAGVALDEVARILRQDGDGVHGVLEQRLFAIEREIHALRAQQSLILELLKGDSACLAAPAVDKAMWVAMLRAAGLDEAGMQRWHCEFERVAPDAHGAFLASLGIDQAEIDGIRAWSRESGIANTERQNGAQTRLG